MKMTSGMFVNFIIIYVMYVYQHGSYLPLEFTNDILFF